MLRYVEKRPVRVLNHPASRIAVCGGSQGCQSGDAIDGMLKYCIVANWRQRAGNTSAQLAVFLHRRPEVT
ncbi:hypothetical protein [Achromobacter marplatensis]